MPPGGKRERGHSILGEGEHARGTHPQKHTREAAACARGRERGLVWPDAFAFAPYKLAVTKQMAAPGMCVCAARAPPPDKSSIGSAARRSLIDSVRR
jgi:hypothetical protein